MKITLLKTIRLETKWLRICVPSVYDVPQITMSKIGHPDLVFKNQKLLSNIAYEVGGGVLLFTLQALRACVGESAPLFPYTHHPRGKFQYFRASGRELKYRGAFGRGPLHQTSPILAKSNFISQAYPTAKRKASYLTRTVPAGRPAHTRGRFNKASNVSTHSKEYIYKNK